MQTLRHTLGAGVLALVALGLQAEDFQSLMKVTQATWPERNHIGVICDYRNSEEEVKALARAAGPGILITVADTRLAEHADKAANLLAGRKAEFVVLMPHDRTFRDGSFGATLAVNRLAKRGVPALGTTPVALRQGVVFSAGDGTHGEILVTDRPLGTIDVILPSRVLFERQVGQVFQVPVEAGSAAISVITTP